MRTHKFCVSCYTFSPAAVVRMLYNNKLPETKDVNEKDMVPTNFGIACLDDFGIANLSCDDVGSIISNNSVYVTVNGQDHFSMTAIHVIYQKLNGAPYPPLIPTEGRPVLV